jgi:hypothetical protein
MSVDVVQFRVEAKTWGIPLEDRFELESLCRTNLKPVEGSDSDDWGENFGFRSQVAQILIDKGLEQKAYRYLDCGRKGYRLRCQGKERHEFFSAFHCDLRFCPSCAPRRFAKLFKKHAPVLEHVRRDTRPGFRLREITLTSSNTGQLTREGIREFNKHVKKTLHRVLKGMRGWGAIWVAEVGFNNTNLHAHVLVYGPYIEQDRLAATWREVSGNQVAWIQQARVRGPKALLHLLKYVSKPPSDKPEILGQLEVAFHGTRRVHAIGAFFSFAVTEEEFGQTDWLVCPKCGAKLMVLPDRRMIVDLQAEGLPSIGEFWPRSKAKNWVN